MPLADIAVHEPDYKRLIAFLKAMEFTSLTRRVAEFSGVDASEIEADGRAAGGPSQRSQASPPPAAGVAAHTQPAQANLFPAPAPAPIKRDSPSVHPEFTPGALVAARIEAARNAKVDRSRYEIVRDVARLNEWVARAIDRRPSGTNSCS